MKPVIKSLPIEELGEEIFAPYGWVVDADMAKPTMEEDIFTFWDGLAEMDIRGKTTVGLLEVVRRPPEFCKLERHVRTEEAFIAISGSVIALVGAPTPGQNLPDPETVRAFRLEPGKGVHLREGTWHWIPYPLQAKARLVVLFRTGTPDEDLEIKDLQEARGLSFKIAI